MTEPLDIVTKFIRVYKADGSAVLGLNENNFTIVAAYKTKSGTLAAWTHASTVADMGAALGAAWNGTYAWTYTKPASGAIDDGIDIKPDDATNLWRFFAVGGELENKDLGSIYAAAVKPVVTVSGLGTVGQVTPVTLVRSRYRVLEFSFIDTNGAAIDMTIATTYTNYIFGVRGKDNQSDPVLLYDQVNTGITAGVGWVNVVILEGSSFFAALAEGAAVEDDLIARYELTADLVAVAGEAVPIVQSSILTITRREVGTA